MTIDTQKALMARNLAFAITRGGQDLTYGGTTGKAIVSASDRTRKGDEYGDMIGASIGASLPLATWAAQPTPGDTFTTQGTTYRIITTGRSYCGHAWQITGRHVSE